jgi:hypothetical protein
MLHEALSQSPLPPEANNTDELNEFLIRRRKERFA